ncbi:hypothetical protein [Ruminococcus flavefaciens]|uniref:hypothetical protein n=1 Tax=Ruminococcus flavefaciens TaxID=1265 RepID=UPI0015647E94|nr:hypothetical protein [Ruminococcus flavefaciens]
MKRNISDILHNADDKTVRRIADSYTAADKKTSDRIYHKALSRMDMVDDDEVRGTDVVRRSPALHRVFLAAACLLVVCGAVFGIMKIKAPDRKPVDDSPVIVATGTTLTSDIIESSSADTTHTVAVVTDEAAVETTDNSDHQPVTSGKTAVSTDNSENAVLETTRPAAGTTVRRTTDRAAAKTTAKTAAKTTDKTGTKTTTTAAATTTQVKPMSKNLTLKDVIELSKKKDALTWSDFTGYIYQDIGSGLYIWEFRINEGSGYTVWVGGVPPEKPLYIRLLRGINKKEYPATEGIDTKNGIDIRYDDVQSFINETQPEREYEGIIYLDDVLKLAKKGSALRIGDFREFSNYYNYFDPTRNMKFIVIDRSNWYLTVKKSASSDALAVCTLSDQTGGHSIDMTRNSYEDVLEAVNEWTFKEAILSAPVAGSLTMDDVIRLHNEKGQQLSPEDFAPYTYEDYSFNGDLIIKFRVTDGENWKLPKNEEVYLTLRLGYGRPLISATLHNADLSKCTDMVNPLPYSGDGTATQFDLEKTLNSKKPWFCE